MLIYNVKQMQGTSQKTGRPYDGYAIEGVALINGEMRNDRAFVNAAAYLRHPVQPGDLAEVLRSGEIYVMAEKIFNVEELAAALRLV